MPENNSWINLTRSRAVVIFVHGILSDSNAWLNKRAKTYWPTLIAEDPQFEDISVFVSGYTAGLGSGLYDVRAAADEVLAHLRNPAKPPAPLTKDRIVFICHSQGGIVVRQMLTAYFDEFASKKVGLILCGSPSWGSIYGTLLAPLTLLLRFRQGSALTWGGSTLRNLDRDFMTMLERKRIPDLTGLCLAETSGRFCGIPLPKVVAEPSATRYFSWQPIAHANHISLVKPNSRQHGSYVHTRDFVRRNQFVTKGPFAAALTAVVNQMAEVERLYETIKPGSQSDKSQAIARLFQKMRAAYDLRDRADRIPDPEFVSLLGANIDAAQTWAFDDFTRTQFAELRMLLNRLVDDLSI